VVLMGFFVRAEAGQGAAECHVKLCSCPTISRELTMVVRMLDTCIWTALSCRHRTHSC